MISKSIMYTACEVWVSEHSACKIYFFTFFFFLLTKLERKIISPSIFSLGGKNMRLEFKK